MARPVPAPLTVEAVALTLPIVHREVPTSAGDAQEVLKRTNTTSFVSTAAPGTPTSCRVVRSSTGHFSTVSTAPQTPTSVTSSSHNTTVFYTPSGGVSSRVVVSYPPGVGWTPVYTGASSTKPAFFAHGGASPVSSGLGSQPLASPSSGRGAYPPGLGWTPVAAGSKVVSQVSAFGNIAEAEEEQSPKVAQQSTVVVLPSPKARLEEARLPCADEVEADEAEAPLEREVFLFFREAVAADSAGAPESPEAAGFLLPKPGWLRTEKTGAPALSAASGVGCEQPKKHQQPQQQQQQKPHAQQMAGSTSSPGEWYWQASTKSWIWVVRQRTQQGQSAPANAVAPWQGNTGGSSWSWAAGWKGDQQTWSGQQWNWKD